MTAPALDDFLRLAEHLADTAGPIIRRHFRTGVAVHDKDDQTPVTIADREAEAAMRAIIEARFPDHGIIGEEYGPRQPDAAYVWVLDPIDGTKSFVTGKPLFGTLIGLYERGHSLLGVIDMPARGERWTGARGRGVRFNGAPVAPRRCAALAEASLYTTSPYMFRRPEDGAAYDRVRRAVKFALFGADCYAYGLIVSGTVDLVVEGGLGVYDFCGPAAVIESAGGIITDWQGRPLGLDSDGRVVAAGDARVHAEALALLAGQPSAA